MTNKNEDIFKKKTIFPSTYQEFIYKRTYSRWLDKENRREEWNETVKRYYDFFIDRIPENKKGDFLEACESILNFKVMPSMRCLWTAGKALERENCAGYNCSFMPMDNIKTFAEMLYILMNGTGVGFTVEQKVVEKLPTIPNKLEEIDDTIVFGDSKKGWAVGFYQFLKQLYSGNIPKYDLSKLRPAGARLKTFGGRASGPEPLAGLLDYCTNLFQLCAGRKLTTIEVHDICCKISDIVVVGGVRRAACISFSDLTDEKMRHAKDGQFWIENPQRALANNSAVYNYKPSPELLMKEWISLIRSKSGERGILNREGIKKLLERMGRDPNFDFGLNPCGEIILRPYEFCNLSSTIIKPDDSLKMLKQKVRHATILGVIQSTLTNFKFINRNWRKNAEEERLIGVSLTGLSDHPVLNKVSSEASVWLFDLKNEVKKTMKEWCHALEMNESASYTCVKPEGTTSSLCDTSSGLHPRYAPYYIRRIRVDSKDPLSQLLIDSKIPYQPETGQTLESNNTLVFDFPTKSPENATMRDERTAIQQLKYWKQLQENWCTHNPSVTIYVKESEWIEVLAWLYKNWDFCSGIAFLPYDGGVYKLAPYEEITEEEYDELSKDFPKINFDKLPEYETKDETIGAQEFACVGGKCDI